MKKEMLVWPIGIGGVGFGIVIYLTREYGFFPLIILTLTGLFFGYLSAIIFRKIVEIKKVSSFSQILVGTFVGLIAASLYSVIGGFSIREWVSLSLCGTTIGGIIGLVNAKLRNSRQ